MTLAPVPVLFESGTAPGAVAVNQAVGDRLASLSIRRSSRGGDR